MASLESDGSIGLGAASRRWGFPLGSLACLGLLLLGCVYAVLYCSSAVDVAGHARGADDAYISYRYAQNLVNGQGLVFNAGERVEGFTNLLYVLLMAVPFLVHWDVYVFSMSVNTVFVLLTLVLLQRRWRARGGEPVAVLGGLLFALSPSIWSWASSGLETSLVVLLQVASWLAVERMSERQDRLSYVLLCSALALLALARADGFVTAVFAVGFLALKGHRRPALLTALAVGSVVVALFAWRHGYYGDFLPNTYYAKVSSTLVRRLGSSGRELAGVIARQGLGVYLLAIAFAATGVVRALRDPRAAIRALRFEVAFGVAWLAYWLYVGGDNFEDRFLIVLIPLGITLLLEEVFTARNQARLFVVSLAIVVQLAVPARDPQYGKRFEAKYDYRILMGQFIGEHWPGRLLATSAAGKIPFFAGLRTIDTLGLADRYLAHMPAQRFVVGHSKEDSSYVLSRKPDIIAAVFSNDDLDIGWEFPRDKYRSAGYQIRYIVNTQVQSRGSKNILDVTGKSDAEISDLARQGWGAVLLERASAR